MLIRTLRCLGVPQSVAQHIHIKQRQRGYDEASFVESFVLLNGVGGHCLDDFEQLRADAGLPEMLGHGVPSPEAARKFLCEFHDRRTSLRLSRPDCPERSPTFLARMPRCTVWER